MNWRDKILALMKEKRINQKELSKISGITESSVSRYLKNEQRPRLDILINFSKALEVKLEYLLGDETKENNSFLEIATAIARNGNHLSLEEKNKLILLILGKEYNEQ